jgi:hypothetical protein
MTPRPQARSDRLVVRQVETETLVYDLDSDEAHCLNDTCAAVWTRCDGRTSPAEIARALESEEDVVWVALEQLWKRELLVGEPAPAREATISRGRLLKTTLVALPLAATIAAPAQAFVSCLGPNAPCSTSDQCCASNCIGGLPTCADLGQGLMCVCAD